MYVNDFWVYTTNFQIIMNDTSAHAEKATGSGQSKVVAISAKGSEPIYLDPEEMEAMFEIHGKSK